MWSGAERAEAEEHLEELGQLADTAGLTVLGELSQEVKRPNPAHRIGSGKVEELKQMLLETCAETVIFDDPLTPAQRRNLEGTTKAKVIDRSQLILDIFAQRAQTRAGRLQVELAQLEYLLPRLTRQWTHLSRIRGGVGMRGPGESQLEDDRRQVRDKILNLKKKLSDVDRTRRLNSKERMEVPFPTVALVGYTNAGKSSLMNRMTGAELYVADQLFATLDSTVRKLDLPLKTEAMLVDTVGFVAKLPHELVEAFKGTLEQAVDADLILHVTDAAHPELDMRVEVVQGILEELGADADHQLMVYNKIDLIDDYVARPGTIGVSAYSGAGIEELKAEIERRLSAKDERVVVDVPHNDGKLRAWLYEHARVVSEENEEDVSRITAMLSPRAAGRLKRMRASGADHAPQDGEEFD